MKRRKQRRVSDLGVKRWSSIRITFSDGTELWLSPQDVEKMCEAEAVLNDLVRAKDVAKRLQTLKLED